MKSLFTKLPALSLATAALVFAVLRFAPTVRPKEPQEMSVRDGS